MSTLEKQLGVRLSDADLARLDAVTAKIPGGKKHAVARAAIRIGLTALERSSAAFVCDDAAERAPILARPRPRRAPAGSKRAAGKTRPTKASPPSPRRRP